MNNKRLFIDMDGTLAKWRYECCIDDCYQKGYYRNLETQENVLDGIIMFLQKHNDVEIFILSAVLPTEYARKEKIEWLHQYLPQIRDDHIIFSEYGKEKHGVVPDKISRNDFLLDDYTKNLLSWHMAGGSGIKCMTFKNHTNKTWNGPYIHCGYKPWMICEYLEQIIN